MGKLFGIGWAKTGTTTLGKCFEILGYRHQGQDLDLVRHISDGDIAPILKRVAEKDAFEDWPWIILYQELDRAFPGSKFILTVRDSTRWLGSYSNMLAKQGEAKEHLNEIRRTLYGLPFPNVTAEQLVERYESHNREVRDYFRERPDDLLVVDWESGDGWEVLCNFLGREVPNEPFPHANKGSYGNKPVRRTAFWRLWRR